MSSVWAAGEKIVAARAAYTKGADLAPPNAATAWRNFGISLYNANRLGDAVEPLQKSADLDPKNAQTWYLLGASLVYKMTTKKVGDREVVQFAPGTIEAYQKAVELDGSRRKLYDLSIAHFLGRHFKDQRSSQKVPGLRILWIQ